MDWAEADGLGVFIRSLVGLDREAAKQALGGFPTGKPRIASQIEFVNLIVDHLTEHGVMGAALLYESPFTDVTPRGPDGLFTSPQLDELVAVLKRLKGEGKRIHIYGASTKGNTILQWCRLDHGIIDCAADRNPDKFGASTLGTGIPIISEAESRAMNPDYYLVLPWHFKEEFLRREKETLKKGVGFIFPLPTIQVVQQR